MPLDQNDDQHSIISLRMHSGTFTSNQKFSNETLGQLNKWEILLAKCKGLVKSSWILEKNL